MNESPERVEEFKREIASMRIRTPQAETERWLLVGGVVAMAVGLALIVIGWWGASGSATIVDALSYLISGGILGLGLIVVGAALFVRYSMTRYLRYWLVRMIYEDQANTDRSVEATRNVERAVSSLRPRKQAPASQAGSGHVQGQPSTSVSQGGAPGRSG